jgi:cytoskeletal protein RodZ
VILPVTFYWFLKFSKAVNHYTNGELNTAVTFLLLWMLRFIGLAIIQDKFNDMLAAGPSNSSPQTTESVPTSSDATPVQSATNYVAEQPIQTSTIDPTSAPATDVTDNENTSSQPPSVPQA